MKEDGVFLSHIRDAIERIESYTARGKEAFYHESIIQDAVIRNLEIIGEAVKNLSSNFRTQHPNVAWTQIAGMRDVLIHGYFGVNIETVWNAIENRLPELKQNIESLLAINNQ
jgi:uncharacterized protein with HEPN domain